jgi:hypothetical protein
VGSFGRASFVALLRGNLVLGVRGGRIAGDVRGMRRSRRTRLDLEGVGETLLGLQPVFLVLPIGTTGVLPKLIGVNRHIFVRRIFHGYNANRKSVWSWQNRLTWFPAGEPTAHQPGLEHDVHRPKRDGVLACLDDRRRHRPSVLRSGAKPRRGRPGSASTPNASAGLPPAHGARGQGQPAHS